MKKILSLVLLLGLFTGCELIGPEEELDPHTLVGPQWQLRSAHTSAGLLAVPSGQTAYVQFTNERYPANGSHPSFSVYAGCNGMGGAYEANTSGEFKVHEFVSTLIYCEGIIGQIEAAFGEILYEAESYEIKHEALWIRSSRGYLQFEREA